jgi:hypothetical protein
MYKLYAGIGLILLLGFAFWYVHKQSYISGVNAERTKWQDVEIQKNAEITKIRDERDKAKVNREIIYRDKIKTVYQVRDNCLDTVMPAELLQAFCEVGLAGSSVCETAVTR